MTDARLRLSQSAQKLEDWQSLHSRAAASEGAQDIEWYFQYGGLQIQQMLASLGQLGSSLFSGQPVMTACQFFTCPRLESYTRAVKEAIATLDKTRRAFKSQDLAILREKLEALLERNQKL